jgi:chemotaxis protein methyltransferase CheR
MSPSENIAISNEDYLKFREFFYRKTGIFFEDSKRYFVDKRLIERIRASGNNSFRNYFTRLRFEANSHEMQTLINLMTVNETCFFREHYQFDCLVNSMLEEITQHKGKDEAIRVWSVPSSTGEEPYSIAIYLLERWPRLEHYNVEIFSSDIDTDVLEAARQGNFSQRSVQPLPQAYLQKYFKSSISGEFQICQDLRESVEFSRVNVTDSQDTRPFRQIDVIFCRNLLIYFDDLSRRVAAENFYDALNPGGFICLGHSESMSRICNLFTVRRFPEAIVYQRSRGGTP